MTPNEVARPRPRTAPETVRSVEIHLVEGRRCARVGRPVGPPRDCGRSRLVGDALCHVTVVDGEPVALVGFPVRR